MSTTEEIFALPSFTERFQLRARDARHAAMRGLRSAMEAVGMRGPDPDYTLQDDDIRRLASIIERLAQRQPDSGYHEGPKDSSLKAIIIGCTITILSAGIIGAIVLSNEFAAFRAQVTEWQKSTDRRLEILEKRP